MRATSGAGFDCRPGRRRPRAAERLRQALGAEFRASALEIDETREGVRLAGFAAPPTFNTRQRAAASIVYVNGRAARDKLIAGALRAAYLDYLAARAPRRGGPVPRPRPARGRRQRPSRQGRGAVPRRRAGARPHRRRGASGRSKARCAAPPPRRLCLAHRAGLDAARRSRPQRWDWRASPADARPCPEPAQAAFAASPRPPRAPRPTPPTEERRAARRRARAGARQLHRRPDPRRRGDRRPATPPTSASSTSG